MQTSPIFLVSAGRSGTNLFRNVLVSGFPIADMSEIFNPDGDPNKHGYFPFLSDRVTDDPGCVVPRPEIQERLFDEYVSHLCQAARDPLVLIDIKYSQSHLLNPLWHNPDSTPGVLQLIMKRGYPLVHLIRRNLLATKASFELASASGSWVEHMSQEAPPQTRKVRLNVSEIRQDLTRDLARIRFFDQCFEGYPRLLRMFYEDILEDGALSPAQAVRLATFLEQPVPPRIEPTTRKIAPKLRDLIENYEEVVARLAGTPFADMALQ